MPRIMAIDYGGKRCGVAVTDPMQIIATGLQMVPTQELMAFIKAYVAKEPVERFIIGEPKNLDNTPAQSAEMVNNFVKFLQRTFPDTPVEMLDERFTSKMASASMIESGMKKKDRRVKGNVDIISATIILQSYLQKLQR